VFSSIDLYHASNHRLKNDHLPSFTPFGGHTVCDKLFFNGYFADAFLKSSAVIDRRKRLYIWTPDYSCNIPGSRRDTEDGERESGGSICVRILCIRRTNFA